MESVKYNKNPNNFMKRFIITFFMLFAIMSSGFSANLIDSVNKPTLIQDLDERNLKEVNSFLWLTFTNLTFDVTAGMNYKEDTGKFYIISNNNDVAVPFVIQAYYKDTDDQTQAVYNEFVMQPYATESVWLEPDRDNEYMSFYMRCIGEDVGGGFNASTCGAGYQVREYTYVEVEEGVTTIFAPLINGVVDLIKINVSIWKIGYYLIIASLVLGAIGALVLLGFKYYKWADTHSAYKHKNTRK
jgi:hypothetical protein